MAYVTGVVLATSCLLGLSFWPWYVGDGAAGWLWTAHGYLYIVYVVTAFLLALKARWSVVKTLLVMAAGTIPLMSFVAERRVTADLHRDCLITLPLLQRRPPEHGPPEEHGRGREQPPLQGVGEVPPARHAAAAGGRRELRRHRAGRRRRLLRAQGQVPVVQPGRVDREGVEQGHRGDVGQLTGRHRGRRAGRRTGLRALQHADDPDRAGRCGDRGGAARRHPAAQDREHPGPGPERGHHQEAGRPGRRSRAAVARAPAASAPRRTCPTPPPGGRRRRRPGARPAG